MTAWKSPAMTDARSRDRSTASSPRQALAANTKLLLTVNVAAERLGIGRSLMYELIGSGQVESISVGRLRRIPAEALDDYIASSRAADAAERPGPSQMGLGRNRPKRPHERGFRT